MHPDLLVLRLSNSRVFADLCAAELRMLVDFGRVLKFAKGDSLDGMRELLVVLTGKVEVTRGKSDGGTPWTVNLGPVSTFNELIFLGCEEIHESARCTRATTIFALSCETFSKLVDLGNVSAAKIGAALARSVAQRLQERNAALIRLMHQHQALLDSMDKLLTDPEVQQELFGKGSTEQREFSTFKEKMLSKWDY